MSDLRPAPDLRTGNGNPAIGTSCQTVEKPCFTDPKTQQPARCASVDDLDLVGSCTPQCTFENTVVDETLPAKKRWLDCDTIVPGDVRCVRMTQSNKYECVIFCDAARTLGRECPTGWSCAAAQGYRICRPPQVVPDMK